MTINHAHRSALPPVNRPVRKFDGSQLLRDYLIFHKVDVEYVWSLLDGQLCLKRCTIFDDGVAELDPLGEESLCIVATDLDGKRPVDVVASSLQVPGRFGTFQGRAGLLGANEVDSSSTYENGQACWLLHTPIEWLATGCVGCAVVLDPRSPTLKRAAKLERLFQTYSTDLASWLVGSGAIRGDRLLVPYSWRKAA
jgi:hypothetical protein